jgi:hypothetical protein
LTNEECGVYLFMEFDMIKVYRFENNQKWGPYNTPLDHQDPLSKKWRYDKRYILENEHDDNEHPPMQNDLTPEEFSPSLFSACESIESLKEWFGKWFDILPKYNFKVVCYTVNRVVNSISGKQIFFYLVCDLS